MSIQQGASEKKNSCFKIHTCLISKYSNKFVFFMAKPINEIVYNENKSVSNIYAKDIFALADQSQFLNRVYHYKNSLGKDQIMDRIKLIGGFYNSHRNSQLAQYPTMIITGTAKIYKTRQRRLRKMIASDGSSDQSQIPSEDNNSYPSQGFLESVSSLTSQSSLASMFKSVQNYVAFDQETHNIYESSPQMLQISSMRNILTIKDKQINHLICDFDQIDVQKTLKDYQKITKNGKMPQNKNSLNSLSKKPVFQSIIINDKSTSDYISKDKYKKLVSQKNQGLNLKAQFNNINLQIQNPRHQQPLTSREKVYQNYYKKRNQGQRVGDIADRDWRRQKIRDKAAQLLIRVKSQNYLNSRIDYMNY